jgi:hypothetical protein
VGWYGSAYFLTMCAFQLFWGRLYTFFNLKWTYLASIGIFEIGSLICAVAPNSPAFIVGRAIAGAGGGGVFAGSFVIVAFSVPLANRPLYASYLGAMYGVASVIGPLLGGAFTDRLSWRGCFYFNLPLGFIVVLCLVFFFKSPQQSTNLRMLPGKTKLNRLDIPGTAIFIVAIVCVLLALQLGGTTYPFSDGRIIALFTIFGIAFLVWLTWQWNRGENATVPRRIITQRSMAFGCFYSLTTGGVNFLILYFAPLWFQGVKGTTAVQSGIDILPFIMGLTATMMGTGFMLNKYGGLSAPFMILSTTMVSIACGLLTTWNPATKEADWVGYLLLHGLGIGFGWQQPILIAQTVLEGPDIPTGTALTTISKLLGGTIFVSVGENVFATELLKNLLMRAPELNAQTILDAGATELRNAVSPELVDAVISAYNYALSRTFLVTAMLSALSIIGALGVEWRPIRTPQTAASRRSYQGNAERIK